MSVGMKMRKKGVPTRFFIFGFFPYFFSFTFASREPRAHFYFLILKLKKKKKRNFCKNLKCVKKNLMVNYWERLTVV